MAWFSNLVEERSKEYSTGEALFFAACMALSALVGGALVIHSFRRAGSISGWGAIFVLPSGLFYMVLYSLVALKVHRRSRTETLKIYG